MLRWCVPKGEVIMLMKTGVCEICSLHTELFRHDSQVKVWMEKQGWGISMYFGEELDKASLLCPKCRLKMGAELRRVDE